MKSWSQQRILAICKAMIDEMETFGRIDPNLNARRLAAIRYLTSRGHR